MAKPREIELVFEGEEIIPSKLADPPKRGDIFHFAGKRWQVWHVSESSAFLEIATDNSEYL
jgi:hypothetical protein